MKAGYGLVGFVWGMALLFCFETPCWSMGKFRQKYDVDLAVCENMPVLFDVAEMQDQAELCWDVLREYTTHLFVEHSAKRLYSNSQSPEKELEFQFLSALLFEQNELAKKLLEKNPQLIDSNYESYSALGVVVINGNFELAQELIRLNPNLLDENQILYLLESLAWSDNYEFTKRFFSNYSDQLKIKTYHESAGENDAFNILGINGNIPMMKLFSQYYPESYHQPERVKNFNPLLGAVYRENVEMIRWLMTRKPQLLYHTIDWSSLVIDLNGVIKNLNRNPLENAERLKESNQLSEEVYQLLKDAKVLIAIEISDEDQFLGYLSTLNDQQVKLIQEYLSNSSFGSQSAQTIYQNFLRPIQTELSAQNEKFQVYKKISPNGKNQSDIGKKLENLNQIITIYRQHLMGSSLMNLCFRALNRGFSNTGNYYYNSSNNENKMNSFPNYESLTAAIESFLLDPEVDLSKVNHSERLEAENLKEYLDACVGQYFANQAFSKQ